MQTNQLLVISGPTASGKSAVAVLMATGLGGEIINFDATQLYSGFQIGAAAPCEQQLKRVPHHLLGVLSPTQQGNVAVFREMALPVINDIRHRGKVPILAGGSNMYLTALLHGLAELPQASALRLELQELGSEELHRMLGEVDPVSAARLHVNDRTRVIRALEACQLSGSEFSQSLGRHAFTDCEARALIIVLCWERQQLHRRIAQRAEAMLRAGLLEETRAIMERHGENLAALKGPGYAQARRFLRGDLAQEDLLRKIIEHTRQYAKRQMTYWRNEPGKRSWLMIPPQDFGAMCSHARGVAIKRFSTVVLDGAALLNQVRQALAEPLAQTQVWYVDASKVFDSMDFSSVSG